MGEKTKIDWCDSSWNPVTGCMHGCEYCYARRIAERFGIKPFGYVEPCVLDEPIIIADRKEPYPVGFSPTFHRYRLDEPQHWKKPRNIFVCSMADLFGDWVPDEWIKQVFEACEEAPQHRYLFLTKNPGRYLKLANKGLLATKENFWYGYSATKSADIVPVSSAIQNAFISIEPIHENIEETRLNLVPLKVLTDWIIVGAETGNQKGKVVPKREWIEHLVETCRKSNVPLFMKESLRGLMGDDFKQEFPWGENNG